MIDWQVAILCMVILVMLYKLLKHEDSIRKNKKKIKKLKGDIFHVDNATADVFRALIESHNRNSRAIEEMYPTYVAFEERTDALAKELFSGDEQE